MVKLIKLLAFGTLMLGALTASARNFFLLPERLEALAGSGQTVGSSFPAAETAVPADRVRATLFPRLRVAAASAGHAGPTQD